MSRSRMKISICTLLLIILTADAAKLLGHVSNWTAPQPDPDFPGWNPVYETIGSCSYIIPMDYTYQGCGNASDPGLGRINSACDNCTNCLTNNPDFNLFAYGLVNHLLWSDIPVKWIIKTGKAHNGYDIVNVPTVLVYPPRLAPSNIDTATPRNRSFAGGPFLVETVFTPFADPFITNYSLTVGEVRVYITKTPITVDVRYTLINRPYVAIFSSSGYQYILEATLLSAGFLKGLHWDVMSKADAKTKLAQGVCISLAMEPHFHVCEDTDVAARNVSNAGQFVSAARVFLNAGSNFYAMCGGIETYEQCDSEDGASCASCSAVGYGIGSGCNCGTGSTSVEPCYGANDIYNTRCTPTNVGKLALNGLRSASLCSTVVTFPGVGTVNISAGYGYGRASPKVPGYCIDGYFVTQNVNDSSYGGLYNPAYLNYDTSYKQVAQINNGANPILNIAADIPFNQYCGNWEYEDGSSVRYMTLFNSIADKVKTWQQTKLRSANWAHFTVAENSTSRDLATNYSGYPYGIYYAAHAKLPKFQQGKGGNIFYVAGHHYSNANFAAAKTGYYLVNTLDGCVDAGVAPNTFSELIKGSTGQVATSNGGGCFNRAGRRFLLNAVLTPSNLTCSAAKTVCDIGGCRNESAQLIVDPCKAFGICSTSGFKRTVSQIPTSNDTSCARLKCGCNLYLDCCSVCGGDGSTCRKDMNGAGVGAKVPIVNPITNESVTAINGQIPPSGAVELSPLSMGVLLSARDIVLLLSVGNILTPSWPVLSGGVTVLLNTGSGPGPVILQLSGPSVDSVADGDSIKAAVIAMVQASVAGTLDPSRVQVVISGSKVTIIIDGNGSLAPQPGSGSGTTDTAPLPNQETTTNLSSTATTHIANVYLTAGQCKAYIHIASLNVISANIYAAMQTPAAAGKQIQVYIKQSSLPTPTNYDCVSPVLTDNLEFQFEWVAQIDQTDPSVLKGFWNGESASHPAADTCSGKLFQLPGVWYTVICAGNTTVEFYFDVTLISSLSPPVPVYTIEISCGSALYLSALVYLLIAIFVLF